MNQTELNELNLKVAELMGWKHFTPTLPPYAIRRDDPRGEYGKTLPVPNFVSDLNACAEFEKALNEEQAPHYRFLLASNSGKRNTEYKTVEAAMCHATAPQRCAAFVKTMEEKK